MSARINIEKKLWNDPRFQDLMIKVGNRHTAKGMVVELFTLAQEHWFPEKKLIPRHVFERAGLEAVLEVGLAETREEGIYCVGSEKAFAWLFQKQGAGKRSGEVRRKKAPKRPKNKGTGVEHSLTDVERASTGPNGAEPLPLLPSLLPSPSSSSSSSSNSNYEDSSGGAAASPQPDALSDIRSPVAYFIGTYVRAYQDRHGAKARPDLRGKVQGQIKKLLEDVPLARACRLIETYLEMDDQWFMTKAHDFQTFMENLSKVGLKLDTGHHATRTSARLSEKVQHSRSQLERIARGEL